MTKADAHNKLLLSGGVSNKDTWKFSVSHKLKVEPCMERGIKGETVSLQHSKHGSMKIATTTSVLEKPFFESHTIMLLWSPPVSYSYSYVRMRLLQSFKLLPHQAATVTL